MYKFRLIIILFALFFSNLDSFSQSLNLTEVNTTNFPNVQMGFTALNRFGDSEKDLKLSEFRVTENGIDVGASLELECFGGDEPQELNVILVLDKSGSMDKDPNDPKSIRLFNWVDKAVDIFLKEFTFYKRSQVGIIAFAGGSEIRCPFTQNIDELKDSLSRVKLAGPTNYNDPFIGEYNSVVSMYNALSPDYKSQMKTVVIFLTDGQPSAATPTKQFEIVNAMKKIAVQVFSITLLTEMNAGLDFISEQTGGRATRVDTEQDLINIYKIIASEIQNKIFCILKWIAPYGCDPNNLERDVKVTFTRGNSNISNTKSYTAPANSLAKTKFLDDLDFNADMVAFGNPQVNASTTKIFKVFAEISDMSITNVKINPSGPFFNILGMTVNGIAKTAPFVLKQGDTAFVEVQFTQIDKIDYRPANVVFEGTPCERVLPIYGGVSDVILLTPNIGYFKDCNNIEIRWTGIDKTTPVNIYYSTNDGNTWVLLQKDATGFSYIWDKSKFPMLGNKYRIKLEVLPISFYQFAKRFGNATENYGRTIALSNDSLSVYFTGFYTGSIVFDNIQKTSAGAEDIYLVKTDNVGNVLWAKFAGGSKRDTVYGVAVDEDGNAYITGTIRTGDVKNEYVQFGGSSATIYHADKDVFFIAKYDKTGVNAPQVYTMSFEGTAYAGFQARGVNLRVTGSGAATRIRVIGNYSDKLNAPAVGKNVKIDLPTSQTEFEALFNKDLELINITPGAVNRNASPSFATDSAFDKSNDLKYRIGSFTGTRNFAPYSLTSVGLNDIFFTKFGKNKESIDISSNTFGIEKPTLKFIVPNFDFGSQNFGQANSLKKASLINTTNLPIKVITKIIDTGDKNDFAINNIPEEIGALDTVVVEIDFKPLGVGNRTSKLFVTGECANVIEIELKGIGVCNTDGVSLVKMGSTNLNTPKNQITNSIFKNPNDGSIQITPTIINDALTEFRIVNVNGVAYNNTAITVNGF
ncbi:MAG: VWA domain-containing protein, partial [Candidatus Kapaibacteriota bacterium]